MGDLHGQFKGLKRNGQYDMLCREGIRRNFSSVDSTSNNRRENVQFCLRSEFGKLVEGQGKPTVVIERVVGC